MGPHGRRLRALRPVRVQRPWSGRPPGGVPGTNEPVHVTTGPSAGAYRALTGSVADGPQWSGAVLEAASEGTLLFLGLLLAWVGWRALRRRDAARVAGVAVAAAGTLVAYGISACL